MGAGAKGLGWVANSSGAQGRRAEPGLVGLEAGCAGGQQKPRLSLLEPRGCGDTGQLMDTEARTHPRSLSFPWGDKSRCLSQGQQCVHGTHSCYHSALYAHLYIQTVPNLGSLNLGFFNFTMV